MGISSIVNEISLLSRAERDNLRSLSVEQQAARLNERINARLTFHSEEAYNVFIRPDELENNPQLLLDRWTKDLKQTATYLRVQYAGQAGIDAGGLGRQFISDLFANLAKKLDYKEIGQSGLYRPRLHMQPEGFSFRAQEKETYNRLGQAIMFCLNATREYPTGIIFDQGFFTAILNFSEPLLQQDFDALDPTKAELFSELFSIFEKMNESIESELQAVMHMKKYLQPLPTDPEDKKYFLQAIYSVVEDEESVKALKIAENANLEPYFAQLQGALRDFIFRNILRPNLAPLHEIARGMSQAPFKNKLSWQDLHKLAPSELSEGLQGVLVSQKIIDNLQIDAVIPKEKQEWLKKWIATTDDDTRKRFLFALTGSRALGNKAIHVHNAPGEAAPIYFHTCFNSVNFPFQTMNSEAQFCKTLEGSLQDPTYNRA
jgi:hypothetical protein